MTVPASIATGGHANDGEIVDMQNAVNALLTHASGMVNVLDYGATGNGTTNDRAAIVAAMATGKAVFFPPGNYLVGSAFSVPSGIALIGAGAGNTIILRGFTGDFITDLQSDTSIHDITIDGQTATYGNGKGILCLTGSSRQFFSHVTVKNFNSSCLEFAQDGGSEFTSIGCRYYTTGTVGTTAAVKVAATDTQAIPKKFYATASDGCTLFDFGGTDHFWASGFYTNGIIFGAASFNVSLHEARFGSLGGTVAIKGDSHVISAISAVAIDVQCTSSWIDVQAPSWNITESGSAANNSITIVNAPFTPSWTGSTSNPAIGNGHLYSRWSRSGAWIDVQFDLNIGTTTTMGTGTWFFSLPALDLSSTPVQLVGSALAVTAGGTIHTGVVRVQPGLQKVSIFSDGGIFTDAYPFAWANGDSLRFNVRYRVP